MELLKANVGSLAACGQCVRPLIGGGLILNSYLILYKKKKKNRQNAPYNLDTS